MLIIGLLCVLDFHALAQDGTAIPKPYYLRPRISALEVYIGSSTFSIEGYQIPKSASAGNRSYYVYHTDIKKSFAFSIGATKELHRHFEIKLLLAYDSKSYVEQMDSLQLTPDYLFESRTFKRSEQPTNQFVTLQLLPQYIFGKNFRFNFGVGGYVSKLLRSQTVTTQAGQGSYVYDSSPGYNDYDYGLSLNVGGSYPVAKRIHVSVQVVASQGLTRVSDYLLTFNYPPWYYRSYSVLIGLRFDNKKEI